MTTTTTTTTAMNRTRHKKVSFMTKFIKELNLIFGVDLKIFSVSALKGIIVLLISSYFLRAFDFRVLFQKGIATSLQDVDAHCLRFIFLPIALLVDFCKSCFEIFSVMFDELHAAIFSNSSFELIVLFILLMLSANSIANKVISKKRRKHRN